jgi:hypothetical protein
MNQQMISQPSIGNSPQLTILHGTVSDLLVSWDSSFLTTSIPSITFPNTTWRLSNQGVYIKRIHNIIHKEFEPYRINLTKHKIRVQLFKLTSETKVLADVMRLTNKQVRRLDAVNAENICLQKSVLQPEMNTVLR